mgnify:CR=1 FL=1
MFDLTGKGALVTGATGGIGGAIAQALHAQGATVAISGTRREVLDAFAAKLGDTVAVMDDGRIVHRGPMSDLAVNADLQTRLLGLSLGAHQ